MKDHYAVLEVPRNATLEVIKAAYRRLCKLFHPDKNPGSAAAEARMKDINGAWEVLRDDDKRKSYDAAWIRRTEEEAARQRAQAQQRQSGPAASSGASHAEWWKKNWGWALAALAFVVFVIWALSGDGKKTKERYA